MCWLIYNWAFSNKLQWSEILITTLPCIRQSAFIFSNLYEWVKRRLNNRGCISFEHSEVVFLKISLLAFLLLLIFVLFCFVVCCCFCGVFFSENHCILCDPTHDFSCLVKYNEDSTMYWKFSIFVYIALNMTRIQDNISVSLNCNPVKLLRHIRKGSEWSRTSRDLHCLRVSPENLWTMCAPSYKTNAGVTGFKGN